jgi:hypothetical protein
MTTQRAINRAKFDKARAAVLKARDAHDALASALAFKYGPGGARWASGRERALMTRLLAAYDRASERMHKVLAASPRDWTRGVPTCWVVEDLSYEDAVRQVSEPLSVTPPKAYGY